MRKRDIVRKVVLAVVGLGLGGMLAMVVVNYRDKLPRIMLSPIPAVQSGQNGQGREVIGFLPYWLLAKAQSDYAGKITTLTYFGLAVDGQGQIQKFSNPGEAEPGWYALTSGRADQLLQAARADKIALSLLVFSGDPDTISQLVSDPVGHAANLLTAVIPLMQEYGFTDLNLDIENTGTASDSARAQFTQFVKTVKDGLIQNGINSLTVEITTNDAVDKKLIDVAEVGKIANQLVLMAYDYHFAGSLVTGPVSPISGGGQRFEYDVTTAVKQTLVKLAADKLVLGIPLYGYEWETLTPASSSAVIPGSGQVISSSRVQQTLAVCDGCLAVYDDRIGESYATYRTPQGDWEQMFYPDARSTSDKTQFVQKLKLRGLALWALGYEDDQVLAPIGQYLK